MTGIDVLAVGAHPDDVEVGCGGVLALCTRSGMRVAIADLTGGELGTQGTPELREEEARRAADVLGVTTRVNLGLPDGGVGTDPAQRSAVVTLLRTLRPRLVLAPYHLDDRHPDHAAAGRLMRDACFLGGVARWGEGEPHRPVRLHHYMLHHVFEPTYVVDVTPVWEQRTAAVAAFASQFAASAGGPAHRDRRRRIPRTARRPRPRVRRDDRRATGGGLPLRRTAGPGPAARPPGGARGAAGLPILRLSADGAVQTLAPFAETSP